MFSPFRTILEAVKPVSKTLAQARIIENTAIAPMVKKMILYVPAIASLAKPGQFVHIKVGGSQLLRRPLSIADADAASGMLTLIYRIVGSGTAQMAMLMPDGAVDCMGPLGRGFELTGEKPLLVGGGMGIAPLLYLTKALCPKPAQVVMGGRNTAEMFWPDLFRQICHAVHITTDDGSLGFRGNTLHLLPALLAEKTIDMIYTCGPKIMMEGVAKLAKQAGIPCQVSLEEHMACGVGACLSCTCQATDGKRRKICSDGPVFYAGEVFALD